MKFDVVITTYNRPQSINRLVTQLLNDESGHLEHIIVVDSSEHLNVTDYSLGSNCKYIRSSHKNQPYQRYLGYHLCKAEAILYLDDDMELLSSNTFDIIQKSFIKSGAIAINLLFTNDNKFLEKNDKSAFNQLYSNPNSVIKLGRWITGYPVIKNNTYWRCGIKGKRISGKPIEYVSGGAFVVKRAFVYNDFNTQLFDLYNHKLGKGEDGIMGYTLSKHGLVYSEPKVLFYHNDQEDSTYTQNHIVFGRRVAYSRLYLSLEYARLNKLSYSLTIVHYHYYMLWRTFGLISNLFVKRTKSLKEQLIGTLAGWKRSLFFSRRDLEEVNLYWKNEVLSDLNNSRFKNSQ